MKIVKSLQDSDFFIFFFWGGEGFSETNQNKAKEQKVGFLSMLLGTLGANLLGDMLSGKGITRARLWF